MGSPRRTRHVFTKTKLDCVVQRLKYSFTTCILEILCYTCYPPLARLPNSCPIFYCPSMLTDGCNMIFITGFGTLALVLKRVFLSTLLHGPGNEAAACVWEHQQTWIWAKNFTELCLTVSFISHIIVFDRCQKYFCELSFVAQDYYSDISKKKNVHKKLP